MEIPQAILRELRKAGIDPIELLAKSAALDPSTRVEARIELARRFLEEGRALVARDPVQASEKLYKAAEEAVKALAVKLGLREASEAFERGRWTASLLFSAVDSVSARLGEEFRLWWGRAWFLHVEGFHETRLDAEQVAKDVKYIEKIVEAAEKA